jgi:dTDP-4-amino-4,6-dideoxygalactose transaminase
VIGADRTHVFHQYTVRVTADASLDRNGLARRLADAGIGTGIYYPRVVFDYPCYRGHPNVVVCDVPEAERAAHQVLSLPVHPNLSFADLDRVVEEVRLALAV